MIRALLLSLLAALPAAADPSDAVRVDVLPGWRTPAGTHIAALRIALAPGWKTYWRAPGDAGIPPSFDWSGSENLGRVDVRWPTPSVFELNGMRSVGYHGAVVLPLEVTPERAGEPVALSGRVELGICETICVPLTVELEAALAAKARQPDPRIRAALADQPDTAAEAGVGTVVCEVAPIRDGLRLTTRIELAPLAPGEAVVVETADPGIWVSSTETSRHGGTLIARADLVPESAAPFALDRSSMRFTVLGGGRGVDIRGCRGS